MVIGARTAATGSLISANYSLHLGEFFCSSRRILLLISPIVDLCSGPARIVHLGELFTSSRRILLLISAYEPQSTCAPVPRSALAGVHRVYGGSRRCSTAPPLVLERACLLGWICYLRYACTTVAYLCRSAICLITSNVGLP